MINAAVVSFKTQAYITNGITSCNLSKQEMKQLIIACQILCMPVTFVLLYQFVELIARYEVNDLSEDIFADIHNSAVLAAKLFNQIQIEKE